MALSRRTFISRAGGAAALASIGPFAGLAQAAIGGLRGLSVDGDL